MTANIDRELDQAAIDRLESATRWLITDATPRLYSGTATGEQIVKELIHRHKVTSYIVPRIGDDYELVRYIPKSRGLYYDVLLLTSTTHQGRRYEYWVVFRTSKDWATLKMHDCRFLIATSSDERTKRTIVQSQRTFIERYYENGTAILDLSDLNPALRAKLRPDEFEGCYEHHDGAGKTP